MERLKGKQAKCTEYGRVGITVYINGRSQIKEVGCSHLREGNICDQSAKQCSFLNKYFINFSEVTGFQRVLNFLFGSSWDLYKNNIPNLL